MFFLKFQMLRAELRRAEGELEDRCWAPPAGLQQWLQLTHEVENRAYIRKKQQADMQLQQARDAVSFKCSLAPRCKLLTLRFPCSA